MSGELKILKESIYRTIKYTEETATIEQVLEVLKHKDIVQYVDVANTLISHKNEKGRMATNFEISPDNVFTVMSENNDPASIDMTAHTPKFGIAPNGNISYISFDMGNEKIYKINLKPGSNIKPSH